MSKLLLRACAGLLLATLCAELLVRQFWVHKRVFVTDYVKIAEPFGRTVWGTEGYAVSSRGAHGVREGHGQSGARILVLGDSFTEALNVDNASVYTAVAERRLRADRYDLSLLNAGAAGRSFADYILFADRHLSLFRPDWVVVQLSQHDFMGDAFATGRNHLLQLSDGRLEPQRREFEDGSGIKEMLWNSPSIAIRFSFARLKQFIEARERPRFFTGAVPPSESSRSPDPVEALLDTTASRYAGRITFLFSPNMRFNPNRVVETDELRRFESHCRSRGYSCVVPREEYMELARAHQSPAGFLNTQFNVGHLNLRGHRAIAGALAAELARLDQAGRLAP